MEEPLAEYVVIACRADHPSGYDYKDGTAHGYSTLLIPVDDLKQLSLVKARLLWPIWDCFPEPTWAGWYGGMFDFIGYVQGSSLIAFNLHNLASPHCTSLGDNRAVTIITARSLLNDDPDIAMQKLQEARGYNKLPNP